MKDLFYKLFVLLFLNLVGQFILLQAFFAGALYLGGRVDGSYGLLGLIIGLVWFGVLVLFIFGMDGKWKARWLKEKVK